MVVSYHAEVQVVMCVLSVIPPEGPAPPVLCGENSGQHMYTSLNGALEGCVLINLYISAAPATRRFSVRARQTVCGSGPPDGCLQWFEGVTGTVQSFNEGGQRTHLAGQQYTVCVRRQRAHCSICWAADTFQVRNGRSRLGFGFGRRRRY